MRIVQLLTLLLPLAWGAPLAWGDTGGTRTPPAGSATSSSDTVPKAGPRGADHVASAKLPPFWGIFGSADLIAKVGFRGKPGSYLELMPDAKTAMKTGNKGLRIAQVMPSVPGARWIEISGIGDTMQGVAMRMLTRGEGIGNVERIIVQTPQMPAMELPMDSVTADMPLATPGGNSGDSLLSDVKHLGSEKVTVPIGTFKAEHWLVSSTKGHRLEIWTTEDERVPFTGCVKMATDTGVIVASRVGTDAAPTIDVPPQAQH